MSLSRKHSLLPVFVLLTVAVFAGAALARAGGGQSYGGSGGEALPEMETAWGYWCTFSSNSAWNIPASEYLW